METILEYILGWAIEYAQGSPEHAVYVAAGLVTLRFCAFLLSLIDNFFSGEIDGRVRGTLMFIIRVLNRFTTAQGAARTIAGKANKRSATAKRVDDKNGRAINLNGVL